MRSVVEYPVPMRASLHLALGFFFLATPFGILPAYGMDLCDMTRTGSGLGGDDSRDECPIHEDSGSCEEDASEDEVVNESDATRRTPDAAGTGDKWCALRIPVSLVPTVLYRPPIV